MRHFMRQVGSDSKKPSMMPEAVDQLIELGILFAVAQRVHIHYYYGIRSPNQ